MNIMPKNNSSSIFYYQTPAGILQLTVTQQGIIETVFIEPHQKLAQITFLPASQLPTLAPAGTPFQLKVWQAASAIPLGTTISYQELAQSIGYPKAFRAVANALGANKIAYFIPCHRIVRKNGHLGGYKWGIERKSKLLASENIFIP
jgi:O-6-methylguanine DNA methyltransferase